MPRCVAEGGTGRKQILWGIGIRKLATNGRGSISKGALVGERKDKLGKTSEIRENKRLTFLVLFFLIYVFPVIIIRHAASLRGGQGVNKRHICYAASLVRRGKNEK